jgi:flagellar motor switch protein FliG
MSADDTASRRLTRKQKAAVIIGMLGADAAGPVLERLDETSLRHFTHAMSGLSRIDATQVRATIAEFIAELSQDQEIVRGGLGQAREVLKQHVAEGVLLRILDAAESPSSHNVWQKVAKINEEALADFLTREHPQTAAVVVSKFNPEHAARILNRLEPELARDVVIGLARAANLDPHVIEAIGDTLSRDFLASHWDASQRRNPADRIGAIMNFTSPSIRDHILGDIENDQPEFAEEIRRKMFTIEDIPARVPSRAVATVVRSLNQEVLLKALFSTKHSAPETREFILSNISARMSEQLREELGEMTSVRRKDGENAQAEVIRVIRELVATGEVELVEEEDG